jgi:hypothetical protein
MTYAQAILDEQGITQSAIAGNQEFSSGLDRLIAQADVQEVIESNQELYRKVEQMVFEIVKAQRERVAMPISAEELTVIYQRPKVLVSDSEILDNIAKMKNLGIFQDYELLQAFDPNLTEDQAKAKITGINDARNEAIAAIGADPSKVFNGAQVASIVEVATKVGLGELTREAGAAILSVSFGISPEIAVTLIPPPGSVTIGNE